MASTSAGSPMVSSPSVATSSKPPRILACVLCQHRKIKCDRTFPCANCTKANVKCTPSTPAPARKRRRPNQDLQERLARCEELLKEYATEKPESPAPRQLQQLPAYDEGLMKWHPAGKLVKEDGGVRFMDSFLLGTVYDELRAMREIVDADDNDDVSPDTMTPDDNSDLILGGDLPEQTPESLWPDAAHVFRLWQIFLDRVNPLTKIIHVPTLQPYLAAATSGSQHVPRNIEALLFSIYLMAVISLTADECQTLLGYSREEALQRFSSGVRLSLLRMGFLKTHDLTTLQALVIYLISLQGRYNRHAAWVLNGVVIRIAQKMGLHRDGEILGLPPFESEMRRRLWWQIIMVDAKYAMLSGLSHSLLPRNWDTKAPKNVNDADIYPSATEPVQDRDGPTEMIFCLILYKFAGFLVQTPGVEAMILATEFEGTMGPDGPSDEQMAEYRRTVENLGKELLDLLDRYCDPTAGPVHEMAIDMREHLIKKLSEIISPPKIEPDWTGNGQQAMKDNAFKVAVATMEHNEQNYLSSKDKGFIWFSLVHFQPDVFMYMAGQLCHRTEGPLVERAWRQVEVVYTYHPELVDLSNKTYSTLAIFILKAWKKREEVIFNRTGQFAEVPFYIDKLRSLMPNDDYKTQDTPPNPYTPTVLAARPPVVGADPMFDQFLGGYLDVSTYEWDMFSGMMAPGPRQAPNPYSGFGMDPTGEW